MKSENAEMRNKSTMKTADAAYPDAQMSGIVPRCQEMRCVEKWGRHK